MRHKFGKVVVVALGGSVIYPSEIDVAFLKQFRIFARKFLKRGRKFVLVIGGGKLSRLFQDAAGEIASVSDEDKDWIGIHATRLNAQLLRTIFYDIADPVVFDARHKIKELKHPITIASGWRPGWSTDFIAVQIAADLHVHEVVIAGKPSYVYPVRSRLPMGERSRASGGAASNGINNKDHEMFDTKRPFEKLSWQDYRKLVPKQWKPGLHAPVDPVGAWLAQQEGIKAIIVHGKDLKNFGALLNGKEFKGTIIG